MLLALGIHNDDTYPNELLLAAVAVIVDRKTKGVIMMTNFWNFGPVGPKIVRIPYSRYMRESTAPFLPIFTHSLIVGYFF